MDAAPVLRHGGLGISSFILSVIAAVGLFLAVVVSSYANSIAPTSSGFNKVISLVILLCLFLTLIAIGLGIAGWRDKTSKPGFWAAGLAISSATVAMTVAIVVVAWQMD